MSKKPSKPETRIEDYLDVMTGGNTALPQPILRIEFYYAFLAGMTVELPQPILDDEKLLAKICGMEVEAPTYIPGQFPRLYAYMAKKGGQDVQVPDPILRLERYWYDYSAGEAPSVQEYAGAVPVTFIADGTPLLDYLISGNTVQSGTPTPDNPIMPEGAGDRTGQLIDYTQSESGGIDGSGNNVPANNLWRSTAYTPIDETLQYFVSWTANTNLNVVRINYYTSDKTHISREQINTSGTALTIPQNAAYLKWTLYAKTDFIIDLSFVHSLQLMINTGSTPLPYEPYGYKIPISSANTTTSVYLGEVETTRKIRKYEFTGEEDWSNVGGQAPFQYMPSNFGMLSQDVAFYICSHYKAIPYNASWSANDKFVSASAQGLRFKDTTFGQNLDDFKSYLAAQYAAGTPVTIWYVLATPETAVVNEPLMKIGGYADTVSMEQAGVQIPTANSSTTLDVETTVKPSEVYIKYRGEAVASLSALPAEVSSPEAVTEEENPEEMEETENER